MPTSQLPAANPERVLVHTPTGRDAVLTLELLRRHGLQPELCRDLSELASKIGEGAGAALIGEESLSQDAIERLEKLISAQPPWSDFPIIILGYQRTSISAANELGEVAKRLGNVTLLDRPVHVRTMLAAVHTALRARYRQYEARRAIDSRDQFLAMLGHELRNPLAALTVATELIRRKPDPKTQQAQRSVIERHVSHLSRLVDDLLDVARVATGKIDLEKGELDLRALIQDCVETAKNAARLQGLALSADLGTDPAFVLGDRVRLDQVFTNLLTNAIKYTPRHGWIRVQLTSEAGLARVLVSDSGIGIDQGMLNRVFDLFAQADRSLERARGGLGIGLTLVQSLVRLHGGKVELESEGPGKGSNFVVCLPLSSEVGTRAGPVKRPSAPPPSTRIVVVEDNDDIREGLQELLDVTGHHVSTAADGIEGIRKIVEERPDLALVDIGLPGVDGYEVARRVRQTLGDDIHLVALTGYGQLEDRKRALNAGFDAHVAKPVGVEEVQELITAWRAEKG